MTTSAPHHLRALPITLQTFFQTIQLDSQNTQNEGPNCLDGYIYICVFLKKVALVIYSTSILIDSNNRL